jgi:hypothetical protein
LIAAQTAGSIMQQPLATDEFPKSAESMAV